jgi:hypothetical protein
MRLSTDYFIDYISAKGHHHISGGPFADLASARAAFKAKAFQLPHSTLRLRRGASELMRWHAGHMQDHSRPRAISVAY